MFKKTKELSGAYGNYAIKNILFNNNKFFCYPDLFKQVVSKLSMKQFDPMVDPLLPIYPNLATELIAQGHNVKIIKSFQNNKEELKNLILKKPTVVVITTLFYEIWDILPVKEIVDFIRQIDDTMPIVTGGPLIYKYCCLFPEDRQELYFTKLGADIYITEEKGINSLALVANALSDKKTTRLTDIPNLAIKKDCGGFIKTRTEAEKTHLNDKLIDWKVFSDKFSCSTVYLQTKRGCNFNCSFCNYPKFSSTVEIKSLDFIRQEMVQLADLGIKQLVFSDDSFNVPLNHFKNIMKMMIKEKFNFSWVSFIRVANLDQEAIDLMARSGAISLFLGLESCNQQILNNMNKKATVEKYASNIDALNQTDIITFASLIAGFPGETKQSVMDTIEFFENHPTTFYNVNLYYHDLIADIARKDDEFGIKGEKFSWQHNSMTWKEALGWQEHMVTNITRSIYAPYMPFYIPMLIQEGLPVRVIKQTLIYLKQIVLQGIKNPELNKIREVTQKMSQIIEENMLYTKKTSKQYFSDS